MNAPAIPTGTAEAMAKCVETLLANPYLTCTTESLSLPDVVKPSPRYVGWQKLPDKEWQRIDASINPSKGGCYNLLMDICELAGQSVAGAMYVILLEGEQPRRQSYTDRMMRPRV